jgi:hypothetical protein
MSSEKQWIRIRGVFWRAFLLLLLLFSLSSDSAITVVDGMQARRFTRPVEFDFFGWTLEAVAVKLGQFSLGSAGYLEEADQRALVLEYMHLLGEAQFLEGELASVYGNPSLDDPIAEGARIANLVQELRSRLADLQPIVEAVLAEQAAVVISELGLNAGGAVFPPVAFHFSRVPGALIISPREVIRQEGNIQLRTDLTLEAKIDLEARVEAALDVSALVVPVGGIGTYPTMIQETTALTWLIETIVHEWVHNYLTLRPLGWNYNTNSEIRTMNETTASILGREIGRRIQQKYYPELPPPPPVIVTSTRSSEPPPQGFDFRAEMHETRVNVDAFLMEGMVEIAEAYMEERRVMFWNEGYHIRRLNQAYFAFYGAYADVPGGPAGEDPVGEAVRELWARIQNPAEFLREMARLSEFSDLLQLLNEPPPIP